MKQWDIVLADDHVLIRKGIRKIIDEHESIRVIGEVGDGIELISLLEKNCPDLIVLDISMPNLRGIEVIGEAKKLCPKVKVLMMTMHKNEQYFFCSMAAGADGYLLKEDSDEELFTAIHTIRNGELYISPVIAEDIPPKTLSACLENKSFPCKSLTKREVEVLRLVAEGHTSKTIADKLSISVRTVEHHRANVLRKLGLKNTADLIKHAIESGLINRFL
jgi:DNA-binding NarL/FixJ family response regulator